ncbi:MAG: phage tail tube protein [Planctomycetota bacterium]
MASGLGQEAYVGFGEESIFADLVARSKFLKINSESIEENEEQVVLDSLYEDSRHEDDVIQGKRMAQGSFEFFNRWEGAELLFKHLFGSVSSSQPDSTNDPDVWQHIFTLATALPIGLSFEINRDTGCLLIAGCKIKNMRFALNNRGGLVITPEIIGADATYSSKSSESFTETKIITYKDAEANFIYFNNARVKVNSFEMSIAYDLDDDWVPFPDREMEEPVKKGNRIISGSFVAEFDTVSRRTDFLNAQSRALRVKFEGAVITGGSDAFKQTFQLDCPAIKLNPYSNSVSAKGRILEKISFNAFKQDDSNKEVKLTLINTVTSV